MVPNTEENIYKIKRVTWESIREETSMQRKQNKAQVGQKETKGSSTKTHCPVTYTEWTETRSTAQYSEGANF